MRTILISLTLIVSLFSSFSSFSQNVGKIGLDFEPKWNIDMSKYPGMHPAQAFEMESYNRRDLPGKIEFTEQALDAERKNLKIDQQMGESKEQIEKDKEEIRKLEDQLRKLQQQNQPSV